MYKGEGIAFGGGKPEKVVSDITKYKSSGAVLELGSGEGRNSLFLAEQGFDVTAQDISEVGLEKLKALAEEKGFKIKTEVKDITESHSTRNYDVHVCTYVLHHLPREVALSIIRQMKNHTLEGGLNAISTFTQRGDFFKDNPDTPDFYPKTLELKKLYADWELLEYEEVESIARSKRADNSPMMNVAAQIVARKPKG